MVFFLFFPQCILIKLLLLLLILMFPLVQVWQSVVEFSGCLLGPLTPICLWVLLCFLAEQDVSSSSFNLLASSVLYQPFLQGALVPLSGEWYLETKIRLSVLIATRVSPPPLGSLRQGYMCAYTHTHTHTHLYLHFDICLYILKTMDSQWYLKSLPHTTGFILGFILFHIYNYLLWQWDSWLPLPCMGALIPHVAPSLPAGAPTCYATIPHPGVNTLVTLIRLWCPILCFLILPHPCPWAKVHDVWSPLMALGLNVFRKEMGKGLGYSCVILNKTHLRSPYLKIVILSFLNFLFAIFKSSFSGVTS